MIDVSIRRSGERALTSAEAAMNIVRRVAALLLLEKRLDSNYAQVLDSAYVWNPASL